LNRENDRRVLEENRRHDAELVAAMNNSIGAAVDKIVAAFASRPVPVTPEFMPYPFPVSPSSDGRASPYYPQSVIPNAMAQAPPPQKLPKLLCTIWC